MYSCIFHCVVRVRAKKMGKDGYVWSCEIKENEKTFKRFI